FADLRSLPTGAHRLMVRIDAMNEGGHPAGPLAGRRALVQQFPEIGVSAPARNTITHETLFLPDGGRIPRPVNGFLGTQAQDPAERAVNPPLIRGRRGP